MKFEAQASDLKAGVQGVARLIPKVPVREVQKGIRLTLNGGMLTAIARDDHHFIASKMSVSGHEDGTMLVSDGNLLASFLAKMPDGTVTIQKRNDAEVLVGAKSSKMTIPLIPDKLGTFPAIQATTEWILPQATFLRLLNRTAFAVGTEESRPALQGVYFVGKQGKLWAFGTDASVLSYSTVDGDFGEGGFTLPNEVCRLVSHFLKDSGDVKISIDSHGRLVRIAMPSTVVVARTLSLDYPDVFRFTRIETDHTAVLNRREFLSVIDRAQVVLPRNAESVGVRLTLAEGVIRVSAADGRIGSFVEEVQAKVDPSVNLEVTFNPRYLISVLRSSGDDEVSLNLKQDTLMPGVIKGSDFTSVLMPLRVA